MTRRMLVAGNWKLHCNRAEAAALVEGLRGSLGSMASRDIVLVPPYTALGTVVGMVRDTEIAVGAQEVFHEDEGAFTGAISAPMLKDAGCTYCLVGHSERRQLFFETDEGVNMKTKALLRAGIRPIVCLGETLADREDGETEVVLHNQFALAFGGLTVDEIAECVVAYEPVWAIGTGRTATPHQAQEAHAFLRGLVQTFDEPLADMVQIIYGGSVKPANAELLFAQPDVDGGLVGGASLEPKSFAAIAKAGMN